MIFSWPILNIGYWNGMVENFETSSYLLITNGSPKQHLIETLKTPCSVVSMAEYNIVV